ncbi:MAG: hypothetical protein RL069_2242 [Planctomycetota bacterium]|jgi:hypothetical protein
MYRVLVRCLHWGAPEKSADAIERNTRATSRELAYRYTAGASNAASAGKNRLGARRLVHP